MVLKLIRYTVRGRLTASHAALAVQGEYAEGVGQGPDGRIDLSRDRIDDGSPRENVPDVLLRGTPLQVVSAVIGGVVVLVVYLSIGRDVGIGAEDLGHQPVYRAVTATGADLDIHKLIAAPAVSARMQDRSASGGPDPSQAAHLIAEGRGRALPDF